MKVSFLTWFFVLATALSLAAACGGPRVVETPGGSSTANGERIYFTASNEQGEAIRYTAGPTAGGMGMMGGQLACVSCHGPDGRGGLHTMHMQVMDAPDIRWSALAGEQEEAGEADGHEHAHAEYALETFGLAVVDGQHPNGVPLSSEMPRWNMSDDDLADLAAYLQSLP